MTESAEKHKASYLFEAEKQLDGSFPTISSHLDEQRHITDCSSGSGTSPDQASYPDSHTLPRHRSRLPIALYLLSFAPPFRVIFREFSPLNWKWRDIFSHPYTLYALGTITAIPSGCALAAMNMLLGYWTNGITRESATPDEITARGSQAAWIMAVVAFVILLTSWTFPFCCVYDSLAFVQLTNSSPYSRFGIRHPHGAPSTHVLRLRHCARCGILRKGRPGGNQYPLRQGYHAHSDGFRREAGIPGLAYRDDRRRKSLLSCHAILLTNSSSQALSSSFAHSPRLAGVLFSVIPVILVIIGSLMWANNVVNEPANKLEGRISSFVEQIFSSVRIVQSFNMGPSLIKRFDGDLLQQLRRFGAKRSVIRSLSQSSLYLAVFSTYSLAFWFGGIEVKRGIATGDIVTVSNAEFVELQ
jgi:ATP-binding cassette subfamily B (MDR/TAP) protein 1